MSNDPVKPPSMPWIIPYLTVANVADAIEFYKDAFGFEIISTAPDEKGNPSHAELRYEESVVMCGAENANISPSKTPKHSGAHSPVCLYVYCQDADTQYQRACKAGAKTIMEPMDTHWGDRMCAVEDLDGHQWSFATWKGQA